MADVNPERPLICLRDLSNYRESPSSMPDSPTENKTVVSQPPPMSPVTSVPASSTTSRPLSTGSSVSGINGVHSPHSSLNGRTPSPTLMGSGSASQQLPPACGARQLSKLKRFLTTLMQFGSDISPDIGERVRGLVLALVNSHLSIEEFHAKLQEATNFPLRPFVIPFLKANLPLLQRELLHCARLAKQTPQQYLAHNEHILFDPANSPIDSQDFAAEINENGKRRSPDRPKENGVESPADLLHPSKRPAVSPGGSSRISPGMSPFGFHGGPIRLEDISRERELRERERLERERLERERLERERHSHYNTFNYHRPDHFDRLDRIEDEWRNVENMLHSILGMVDKCRRALAVLQERTQRDREELALWMRRHHEGLDHDIKKRSDLMATTLRQTEDRVSEVKRRAEEAVNEVKRQAVSELQKAVAAAETKATEMVTAERVKMERSIADAKKQAHDEVLTSLNTQEDSSESCWNCGRKASETCSGCNVARYCGSFCQHKDWETHHRVCGQGLANRRRAPSTISTPLPATSGDSSANPTTVTPSPPAAVSVPSPANSSNSRSGSRSSTPSEPAKQELVTR